jgi:predicted Fe-Mo cluster-binding NifX family protein
VNTVLLKGINEAHVEDVVKKVRDLGAYVSNIMQLIPVKGAAFENLELVSNREIMALRDKCAPELRQMYHCRQCRADAVGTLDNDRSIDFSAPCGTGVMKSAGSVMKIAVASKSGMVVDQHFGHASEFYIYESDALMVRFLEKRLVKTYCSGQEDCESPDSGAADKKPAMDSILSAVSDCSAVLALRIGDTPARKLQSLGIKVVSTYDRIEDAVLAAAQTGLAAQTPPTAQTPLTALGDQRKKEIS